MAKTETKRNPKQYVFWWAVRMDASKPEEVIKIEVEAFSEEEAFDLVSEKVLTMKPRPLYHYYTNKFQIVKAAL